VHGFKIQYGLCLLDICYAGDKQKRIESRAVLGMPCRPIKMQSHNCSRRRERLFQYLPRRKGKLPTFLAYRTIEFRTKLVFVVDNLDFESHRNILPGAAATEVKPDSAFSSNTDQENMKAPALPTGRIALNTNWDNSTADPPGTLQEQGSSKWCKDWRVVGLCVRAPGRRIVIALNTGYCT
jgi:hypothetical protein